MNKTKPCRYCGAKNKEVDQAALGASMRLKREKAGRSIRATADAMGMTAPYILDLERGYRPWSESLITSYTEALK